MGCKRGALTEDFKKLRPENIEGLEAVAARENQQCSVTGIERERKGDGGKGQSNETVYGEDTYSSSCLFWFRRHS